jgi:hypothetical protein
MEANVERFEQIEETLAACPPTLSTLAARLVVELDSEAFCGRTLNDAFKPIEWTLATLRPFLSGVILRDVSEILDNADADLAEVFERWFGPRKSPSQGWPIASAWKSSANSWSCSSRRSPNSAMRRSSGTRPIRHTRSR